MTVAKNTLIVLATLAAVFIGIPILIGIGIGLGIEWVIVIVGLAALGWLLPWIWDEYRRLKNDEAPPG